MSCIDAADLVNPALKVETAVHILVGRRSGGNSNVDD